MKCSISVSVVNIFFIVFSSLVVAEPTNSRPVPIGVVAIQSDEIAIGIFQQRQKLSEGIKVSAAASLNRGRNNCRVSSHCKVVSLGICGDDKVLYSTFRSNGLEKAISTMRFVHFELYRLVTPVLPGCPISSPPLPQCNQDQYLGWHCALPDAITLN